MGGRVVAEYPFINSVGAELSSYAVENYDREAADLAVATYAYVDRNDSFGGDTVDASLLLRGGLTGKGVGIAVIDTGISPHLEFCVPRMRIDAFVDFIGDKIYPYDDHGHGTAVAGIACGGGRFSYACGAAPQARLTVLKAVSGDGSGNVLGILTAMQWLYTHFGALGVKVVNMSLGSEPSGDNDPLVLGARALCGAGLTVVASAGNAGPLGGLKSPGIAKCAITVGGAEKRQSGWYAAPFSSRGKEGDDKPDFIAPAVDVYTTKAGGGYMRMSGTSAAAPLVSGVCALLLQKEPDLTPRRLRQKLMKLLTALDCPHTECGAGILDPFDEK